MPTSESVLVIGGGVAGLSTGVALAEAGAPVRLRTAEHPAETTSATAGAIWGPALLSPPDRVLDWVTTSYHRFRELALEPDSGVHLAAGRMAARFDLGEQLPPEARLIPDLQRCDRGDLPAGFADGYRGTLPAIDMPRYLRYLTERFQRAGGQVLLSAVSTLAEAVEEADAVVNCTGAGAHELVGDPAVHPVRGQHVVVRNPGIEEYFIEVGAGPEFVGYVPHSDRVVLGGTAEADSWSRAAVEAETRGILRRCAAVEPRLDGAEVLGELVGLRPGRDAVRVEVEEFGGGRIVHNYGHGGSGVALSWGCAEEAARLALR